MTRFQDRAADSADSDFSLGGHGFCPSVRLGDFRTIVLLLN